MRKRGFALIEVLAIIVVLGILAATGTVLFTNFQQRMRVAKAQADGRDLVGAVAAYSAHTGSLPVSLSQLTAQARNRQNAVAGPFIDTLPTAPSGWAPYAYARDAETLQFSISTSGDGAAVKLP
jgi:prepilin-type N-terminal cleavage/methylation domain-containing protein